MAHVGPIWGLMESHMGPTCTHPLHGASGANPLHGARSNCTHSHQRVAHWHAHCATSLCTIDSNASIPTKECKAIGHDHVLKLDESESGRVGVNWAYVACARCVVRSDAVTPARPQDGVTAVVVRQGWRPTPATLLGP
jgi:hypothetical protein